VTGGLFDSGIPSGRSSEPPRPSRSGAGPRRPAAILRRCPTLRQDERSRAVP
jgi:hypothetical protein